MKEIGEQFREKREEIGISIDEVANDLKIDPIIIENLEDGNDKVFKDILELKSVLDLYSKYLGINSDKVFEDLNDYLFEKTSKISVEDIKERLKKQQLEEKKKIVTPYTRDIKDKKGNKKTLLIIFIVIFVVLILFYFILKRLYIG